MSKPSGVKFNEKESDISSLIKNIKNEDSPFTSSKGSIPTNPKKEDLIKFVGNLQLGIPTGFILLHEDFNRLISLFEKEGVSSSSSSGNKSKGGSDVAGAVTAVATSVSAITDLFKGDGSTDFLNKILSSPELIQNISSNADIIDIITRGTQGYLKSYYLNLINNNGYSFDFNSLEITQRKGFDFGSLFKDIGDGIGSIFSSSVSSIMTNLTSSSSLQELQEKEGVKDIHEKGYTAYLKTYYANLTNVNGYKVTAEDLNKGNFILKDDINISSLFKDVADGLTSVISSGVDSIVTSIATNISNITIEKDGEIDVTRKKGYIAYLKTYYANLTNANGYKVLADDLNRGEFTLREDINISSIFKDVSDGLASIVSSGVDSIFTSMSTSIADVALEKDEDVNTIRKKGYIAYLKTYYANMMEPQGYSITADSLNKGEFTLNKKMSLPSFIADLGQSLGSLYTTAIDSITNAENSKLSSTELESDEDIKNLRKEGYSSYLKAYYLSLLSPYGLELDISALNNNNEFVIKEKEGWFSDMLKGISDVSKVITNLFTDSVGNMEKLILDNSINEYPEVKSIRVSGYTNLLNKYFSALNGSFDSKKVAFSKDDYRRISSAIQDSLLNTIKGITQKSTIEVSDNTRTIVTSTYKDTTLLAKIDEMNRLISEISGKISAIQEKETDTSPVVITPSVPRGDLAIEKLTQFN